MGSPESSFVLSKLIDTPVSAFYTTVALCTYPSSRVWRSIMRSNSLALKQCRIVTLMLCLVFGLHVAGCGPFSLGRSVPAPPDTTAEVPEVSEVPEASDALEAPAEAVENNENTPQPDRAPTGDLDGPASVSSTPAVAPVTLWGYRVQLYWFTSRDAAEAAVERVERFLADFSHDIYLNEEAGGFRVRVGDFADKAEADRFRDRMRREGYADAWTARTLIQAP